MNVRRRFFIERIAGIWNSLPPSILEWNELFCFYSQPHGITGTHFTSHRGQEVELAWLAGYAMITVLVLPTDRYMGEKQTELETENK